MTTGSVRAGGGRIATGETAQTNSYVYGLDLSGSLQGAGRVGRLLACTVAGGDDPGHCVAGFYAYDANGNVTDLVGTNGTALAHYEYDPFGNPVTATGPLAAANPFRFSTKYTDDETGLVYYGYRYYSPELGRWLNRDPMEEDGGINIYTFIENESLSGYDILGEVRNSKGISTGNDLNAPWAEEGWGLWGGGGFAGPGYSGRFGDRPYSVFGFISKLHDGAYQYNKLSFSFGPERDPVIRSKKAKADVIFRKMNDVAKHSPMAWAWSQASKPAFYDNVKYFCAGDGYVNVLTLVNWDADAHLMIPFLELLANERTYIEKRVRRPKSPSHKGPTRYRNMKIPDVSKTAESDKQMGGWRGWAQRYFGSTWTKASLIDSHSDASFQW